MESGSRIQSVARALAILDGLAEARRELALHEIAERLGLARNYPRSDFNSKGFWIR